MCKMIRKYLVVMNFSTWSDSVYYFQANLNSKNLKLVSALLVGALFPNIVQVLTPEQQYAQMGGGKYSRRECWYENMTWLIDRTWRYCYFLVTRRDSIVECDHVTKSLENILSHMVSSLSGFVNLRPLGKLKVKRIVARLSI